MASGRAGIGGVDSNISETVEGHRCRTRRDHSDNDPGQLTSARQAIRRQQGAAQRERESKDRVLPLDHLQSYAQIPQDRHSLSCSSGEFGLGFKGRLQNCLSPLFGS